MDCMRRRLYHSFAMASLEIYAGPAAMRRLRKEGICQSQFEVLVAASGGPKWFVLASLDRYLFGSFFVNRASELFTIGSSVGAWRVCCLATHDPVASVERLAHFYCHEKYSSAPTVEEVTNSVRIMLENILGEHGAIEIVNNSLFRTHIIADRSKGIGSSHSKFLQAIHLAASAGFNLISRQSLSLFFERSIFSNLGEGSPWAKFHDISSATAFLTTENIHDVMLASGSIPFVLEGVRNIAGARQGHYWDGGITDYHFDWKFHEGEGLVLYPHFSAELIPGWFDKMLRWRKVKPENLENVVLLAPSKEFVQSLPGKKIPDRKDFRNLDYSERVKRWQEVITRSEELAEEFKLVVETGEGLGHIKPIAVRDR